MMKRLFFSTALLVLLVVTGCAGGYQYQVDQSLLMQENRRLENALYVTHAQLVTLKRENEVLRNSQSNRKNKDSIFPATPSLVNPLLRPKRNGQPSRDDYDEAPPFVPPSVLPNLQNLPEDRNPGGTDPNNPPINQIPDSLKNTKISPPNKKITSDRSLLEETTPDEITFPVVIESEESLQPAWSPIR
jgi:hypothetical protein